MKTMSKLAAALLACLALSSANAANIGFSYVYVGSWFVGDGPYWRDAPTVFSAREAAAFLFGGNAADYAISTLSMDPTQINFMAFVDGNGNDQYMRTPISQDFKLDQGDPGYTSGDFSAFVHDHSCYNRYFDAAATCSPYEPGHNFAFRLVPSNVPEPASLGLVGLALAGLGSIRRRRQKN